MYHKKRDEMITEDYVSFGVAKLLKEKGFNEPCHKAYNYEGCLCTGFTYGPYAPTLQMAVKWLREVKHIPIEILWHYDVDSDVEEWYFVHHAELRILPNDIEYYETYEEACEAAIKFTLENLI